MVELYIDEQMVNATSEPLVTMSYDVATMESVDAAREPRVVTVEVTVVDDSASVFGGEGYLHVGVRFNASEHTAKLTHEGHTLFEGAVTLSGVRREADGRTFILSISDEGAEWAVNAASSTFNTMPIVDEMNLNLNMIKGRWEGDYTVQFFPVHRDDYESEVSSSSTSLVRRIYSIDRYHPFLNVGDMLRAIATNAGYTIESEIMEMDHFKRLYMSGSYVSQENSVAKDVMDFCVKKCSDVSTTASSIGMVSISPYVGVNSVSSLVDYDSIASLDECYARGAYLALDDEGIVTFTPPTGVSVGFDYRIKYVTGYWIESRTKLKALDTFYFGEGEAVQIEIVNLFTDMRGEALIDYLEYFVVVFDYASESGFRLRDSATGTVVAMWSGRTTNFTISNTSGYGELVLEQLIDGVYYSYGGDWAQYQGYVEERGNTEIDLSIRTPPLSLTPTSSKSFNPIFISGAEGGAAFTLREGTTITPYFSAYPGSGSNIEFADVAQHDMTQGTFIEAIRHLFNLRLFTDNEARVIYVDPVEQIYDTSKVWDWSDRVIETETLLYEDVAVGVDRTRVWGYQDGDGVTNRSAWSYYPESESYPAQPEAEPEQSDTEALSPEYGAWQRSIANYASDDATTNLLNPVFSPTQNNISGIPIVGDRDDVDIVDTLEFSPRVVRWLGTTVSGNEELPYTAFHSEAYCETLCFEDRDYIVGLNQYYREQIEREERGQYVTLSLRISTYELIALMKPNDDMPHVLSTFSLTLDGEVAKCRIEQIEEYSDGDGVARVKMLIVE